MCQAKVLAVHVAQVEQHVQLVGEFQPLVLSSASADDCSSWSFNAAAYASTMTLTALVEVDCVEQTSGTLMAEIDGDIHALEDEPSEVPFGDYAGTYQYAAMVYNDDSGAAITYFFCADSGEIYRLHVL